MPCLPCSKVRPCKNDVAFQELARWQARSSKSRKCRRSHVGCHEERVAELRDAHALARVRRPRLAEVEQRRGGLVLVAADRRVDAPLRRLGGELADPVARAALKGFVQEGAAGGLLAAAEGLVALGGRGPA